MTPVRANLAHNAVAVLVEFYGSALEAAEQQVALAGARILELSEQLGSEKARSAALESELLRGGILPTHAAVKSPRNAPPGT